MYYGYLIQVCVNTNKIEIIEPYVTFGRLPMREEGPFLRVFNDLGHTSDINFNFLSLLHTKHVMFPVLFLSPRSSSS